MIPLVDALVRTSLDVHVAQAMRWDQLWRTRDRRGRWAVVDSGIERHGMPTPIWRRVNRTMPRRIRRFSSLSKARAFARLVGRTVQRWSSKGVRPMDYWEMALRGIR